MRARACLALACATVVLGAAPAVAEEAEPIELPIAIEKVWFKTPSRAFSKGGDLIITEEGLEFVFGKRNLSYSMDEIYILSFGTLKGDVDTEWALVAVGEDGPAKIIGVRDGRKLGYGGRTQEIYRLLNRALAQRRAGQYDVPEGYRAFDAIPHHGAFAIPQDWHTYIGELILDENGRSWGTLVFSQAKIESPTREDLLAPPVGDPALQRVADGEFPSFFLVLRYSEPGMDCDGISPGHVERLLASGDYDPLPRTGSAPVEQPAVSPARVGICQGVRIQSRSRRADGGFVVHETYVVAHNATLFALGLHAVEERYEEFRKPLETSLESLRFSVAR